MDSMCYWNMESKISSLRRQVIVHSILYYEMDSPVISDERFDTLGRKLVEMCNKHQEAAAHADYFYCMHDFDGNTGFDICSRLEEHDRRYLTHIAEQVLMLHRKEKKYESGRT